MPKSVKHAFFLVLAVASLFLTWPHGFDWIRDGGNIANPFQFFIDAFNAGAASAFLTVDIAVVWIVYMVWVVVDAQRIGLGAKWGWFFLALSYLGTCFAFPIYLVVRERFLDKRVGAHSASASVG